MSSGDVVRLDLTDSEWMSIIDSERDGLPVCCANVSELRDCITRAARFGGEITFINRIRDVVHWVYPDHGAPEGVMAKIVEQLGVTILTEEEVKHPPQSRERV